MNVGENFNKEILKVKHSELQRVGDSIYRSLCPICRKGILLMQRNKVTFKLSNYDNCVLCGQRFEYIDIESIGVDNGKQ